MKNRTKKILAGACLGIMGLGALTGCSMSEDQMKDINTKVDTSIETFEQYVNDQNKNMQDIIDNLKAQNELLQKELNKEKPLSKEEALKIIKNARDFWISRELDAKLHYDITEYYGLYDKMDYTASYDEYISKNKDGFIFAHTESYDDEIWSLYRKQDYINDVYYEYVETIAGQEVEREFTEKEYHEVTALQNLIYMDVCGGSLSKFITPDMIYNIENFEDGYRITIVEYRADLERQITDGTTNYIATRAYRNEWIFTLKNNRITEFDNEEICLKGDGKLSDFELDADGNYLAEDAEEIFYRVMRSIEDEKGENIPSEDSVSVFTCQGYYEYENIDFSEINQKFAEIEEEYLNTNA